MPFKRTCLLCCALVLGSAGALAQAQNGVTWRASVGATSNDNFFYTPVAPVAERVTAETVGVNLALPYSLQRFELDASLVANQHQTHSSFDFTAQNYNGTWFWSFTPQLHGKLNSMRTETLAASTLSVDPSQRNKSTAKSTALAAAYDLGGPWQLTAGALGSSSATERAVLGQSDDSYSGLNAGLRYAMASGNAMAYFRQVASGHSISNYTLSTDDLTLVWVVSGNTTLNGHLAQLQQRFDATPQFDFSGTAGGINMVWRLTGKTSITAAWQRDLASYQTANASYTQTDTVSIVPTWQISPLTSVRAQYRTGLLTDQGNPFGQAPFRQDRLQEMSLSFNWQPATRLALTATLGESSRRSNVAQTDFKYRQMALLALVSF
jgi:exopolysaccharide biosynthesis operon protein EpsL